MFETKADLKTLIKEVRDSHADLARAKVSEVEIFTVSHSVRVTFINDLPVTEDQKAAALAVVERYIPSTFEAVAVDIKKRVSDDELIKLDITDFLKERFAAIARQITQNDIKIEKSGVNVRYTLLVEPQTGEFLLEKNKLSLIDGYLNSRFCDDFSGALEYKPEVPPDFSEIENQPVTVEYTHYRTITVKDVVPIDKDFITDTSVYIDDIKGVMDRVVLAGTITSFRERQTSKGKPYYIIEITDGSGKITGKYFNKVATERQVRLLAVGESIIMQGSLELYNGSLSLTMQKLARCVFPKDFKPERKQGRGAAAVYTKIFPQAVELTSQDDMFSVRQAPPECMLGKTFVVFDLETTGTEATTDKITEIGAVKVVDGVPTESFSTLVNPLCKISAEITKLTGIDNDLVANAPVFDDVCADFYKFCDGCILVAHNIDFDYKFIKINSSKNDFYYYNQGIDTVQLSRELLPGLTNHKLNTVAEHFGIEFNHHRADSDALATAKMFIKLIELKKSLPL